MDIIKLDENLMQGSKPDCKITEGIWIAGGAVRSWFVKEKAMDIDIFTHSSDCFTAFKDENNLNDQNCIHNEKNVETYSIDNKRIQLIKFYRENVKELLDSFDFTICQFAYDGGNIFTTPNAIVSTLRKHLAVNKIQEGFEMDSFRRAFKYQQKGYQPCIGTMRDIALALSQKEQKELEQQVQMSPGGGTRGFIRWD